jgi:hypothetical protein
MSWSRSARYALSPLRVELFEIIVAMVARSSRETGVAPRA